MKTEPRKISKIILTVITFAVGVACIYPFLFMISSSFKPGAEIMTKPFELISANATVANYIKIFSHSYYDLFQWYANTIIMTLTSILIKFFIVSIAAYAFAKMKFPGKDAIFLILLASMMIPTDIMIMPRYIIFSKLKLIDSMWTLVLPAAVDAYFVFLLRQSFISIPDSISEAARIDGYGHFKIYTRIILPLARPALATMVLFSFVWLWNDYMSAYLYISSVDKQMLSVGIKLISSGQTQDYGAQMAAATVVLIPILFIFIFFQRYFVEGITSGAVKG